MDKSDFKGIKNRKPTKGKSLSSHLRDIKKSSTSKKKKKEVVIDAPMKLKVVSIWRCFMTNIKSLKGIIR